MNEDVPPIPPHRPHTYPVPDSKVTVGGYFDREEVSFDLQVYCAECGKRVFDITDGISTDYHIDERGRPAGLKRSSDMMVQRMCPRCKTISSAMVTGLRGRPVGIDGPWYCYKCNAFLMKISAARGRLAIICPRCRTQLRVGAFEAVITFLYYCGGDEDSDLSSPLPPGVPF